MLKSPVLLRGHEINLRNLPKWVHKSISKFPVLLEEYKKIKKFSISPSQKAFEMSVKKKGDERMKLKELLEL
jgi:hypothetical protein